MDIYARAERGMPLRNDVDESWVTEYTVPQPGVEYFATDEWQFTKAGTKGRQRAEQRLAGGLRGRDGYLAAPPRRVLCNVTRSRGACGLANPLDPVAARAGCGRAAFRLRGER
jgi:hypothetical protein